MHEWLSGGVSPCQGEGRGFESRLVLSMIQKRRYPLDTSFFVCSSPAGFERFECLRSTPVVAVERLILALMKWLWILPGLRCPYSRCQFPGCGSCPSDRWQYGQWSSRQTHARYMESIQEFPYTVLQRRETSPLKNACRKQAGYFLCIASAPSLGQNKERIVAIKKLLCNHFT